jgi:pimeloyl-ACP methyl ester carboxylesterase
MKRLPALAGASTAGTLPLAGRRAGTWPWHIVRRVLALVAMAVIVCGAISAYVGWSLTHPARKALDALPEGFAHEDVQFESAVDHLKLYGWFLDAGSERTVIMVHGYRDNRLQKSVPALDVARGLVDHGYNFLTFDLRNAGQSEGSLTTIGAYEQRDVLGAIAYVKSLGRPGQHIGLLGYSMGGATALLAASQEPSVAAVISDSAFADLYPFLEENLHIWSHLPPFPFTPLILAIEPAITGVDPRLAAPIRAVPQIHAPLLFIHGMDDRQVPYRNSEKLLAAASNGLAQLWLVAGADHVKSFQAGPQAYWDHVLPFLDNALK